MKLHLFNPDNDSALAADQEYYTPSKAAVALRRSGSMLPWLWADDGDMILVAEDMLHGAEEWCGSKRLSVKPVAISPATVEASPWGWSRAAKRTFLTVGVAAECLPDDSLLETWRNISHRRSTIRIHNMLGLTPPVEVFSAEEALDAVRRLGGMAMVKLPWSSSGRGVWPTAGISQPKFMARVSGEINHAGSVMIEPLRDKINDFAALYAVNSGVAEFAGLSLFKTSQSGAYSGNIVMGDRKISDYLGIDAGAIASDMTECLNRLLEGSGYSGMLGVDMMTYRGDEGKFSVEPCVEINLRSTMGFAALALNRRHNIEGEMIVVPGALPPGFEPLVPGEKFAIGVRRF